MDAEQPTRLTVEIRPGMWVTPELAERIRSGEPIPIEIIHLDEDGD